MIDDCYRVEGEFTRHELRRVQGQVEQAKLRLTLVREDLTRRRARARLGEAESQAKQIGKALKDSDLRQAMEELDLAEKVKHDAWTAFNRCSRTRRGGLTKTGQRRSDELASASCKLNDAQSGYEAMLSIYEIEDSLNGHGPRVGRFKRKLKTLIDSYRDLDVPERIAEEEVELARLAHVELLTRTHLVPEKKLKAFARFLDPPVFQLLLRLRDGYCPRPQTMARPEFVQLEDAGLIQINHTQVLVQPIGHDVVDWVAESEPALVDRGFVPFLTRAQVKEAFTPAQLRDMADEARALFEEIQLCGDHKDQQVEVGLPEQGFSYQIVKTRFAVQRFLRVIGGPRKLDKKDSGPKLLRTKCPPFEPGKVLVVEEVTARTGLCPS